MARASWPVISWVGGGVTGLAVAVDSGVLRSQGVHYKPHYPVYKAMLAEAVETGVDSLLKLDPKGIYERAKRGFS